MKSIAAYFDLPGHNKEGILQMDKVVKKSLCSKDELNVAMNDYLQTKVQALSITLKPAKRPIRY